MTCPVSSPNSRLATDQSSSPSAASPLGIDQTPVVAALEVRSARVAEQDLDPGRRPAEQEDPGARAGGAASARSGTVVTGLRAGRLAVSRPADAADSASRRSRRPRPRAGRPSAEPSGPSGARRVRRSAATSRSRKMTVCPVKSSRMSVKMSSAALIRESHAQVTVSGVRTRKNVMQADLDPEAAEPGAALRVERLALVGSVGADGGAHVARSGRTAGHPTLRRLGRPRADDGREGWPHRLRRVALVRGGSRRGAWAPTDTVPGGGSDALPRPRPPPPRHRR